MIELVIKDKLRGEIPGSSLPLKLISFRKLKENETELLRGSGVSRFFLPSLSESDKKDFYREFDRTWDKLVEGFGQDHVFWRNIVSSKVQEWEKSIVYLMEVLFTLSRIKTDETMRLLILTDSIEEAGAWKVWAKINDWKILSCFKFNMFKRFVQELRSFIKFGYFAVFAVYSKIILPGSQKINDQKKEHILISSLSYPWSFNKDGYRDPFFKEYHKFLFKNNKDCSYINEVLFLPKMSDRKAMTSCNDVVVNTIYSTVSWATLISVIFRVFVRRIGVKECLFFGCDFSSLVEWKCRSFLDYNGLNSEIVYESASTISKNSNIDYFLLNFEGNVFERSCIQAFKKNSDKKICGYGQSVVFESNFKLKLTEQEIKNKPQPDFIVSTGTHATELLSRMNMKEDVSSGCALREIPRGENDSCVTDKKRILFALDGMRNTGIPLDWFIENWHKISDEEVILRTHPNVPIREVLAQCINELPENFEVSDSSLVDDLKRSYCVFYRHTSIGMQALLNNIPVVHLAIDTPMPGDPISDLEVLRWKASTIEELKSSLEEIKSLNLKECKDDFNRAREFVDSYFSPPNDERFGSFVKGL